MDTDDAALVVAARSGNREAFGAIYDRYADRLYDFCWGLLRDRDEAADAVHDAFLIAVQRLGQLRDPAALRAWLYAIARHEATRRGKARAREAPTEVMVDVAATEPGPDDAAGSAELGALVWAAAGGLDERDRVVMELSVRQGLDTTEIGAVIGVRTAHASVLVNRMRDRVERSLGALLVARLGRRDCPKLQQMLAGWDGTFTVQMRKRVARHADECRRCDQKRRGALSPLALLGATAAMAAPAALRDRVMDDVALVGSAGRPWPGSRGGFPPRMDGVRPRRRAGLASAAVLALIVALGVSLLGPTEDLPSGLQPGASPTGTPSSALGGSALSATPSPDEVSPSPGTGTTAAPTPHLTVSAGTVDFGTSSSLRTVTLHNDGGDTLQWSASPSIAQVVPTPSSGSLEPGGVQQLTITLNRGQLDEGSVLASIHLSSDGGDREVQVLARVERSPVILDVSAGDEFLRTEGGSCGPDATNVTTRVTDESQPLTVVLHWAGGATGSTRMQPGRGERFTAQLGPFAQPGTVEYWVVATDARGNEAASPPQQILVEDC